MHGYLLRVISGPTKSVVLCLLLLTESAMSCIELLIESAACIAAY